MAETVAAALEEEHLTVNFPSLELPQGGLTIRSGHGTQHLLKSRTGHVVVEKSKSPGEGHSWLTETLMKNAPLGKCLSQVPFENKNCEIFFCFKKEQAALPL